MNGLAARTARAEDGRDDSVLGMMSKYVGASGAELTHIMIIWRGAYMLYPMLNASINLSSDGSIFSKVQQSRVWMGNDLVSQYSLHCRSPTSCTSLSDPHISRSEKKVTAYDQIEEWTSRF